MRYRELDGGSGHRLELTPPASAYSAAQNLAREFGPQGVHVSHVIVDGEGRAAPQPTVIRADRLPQCRSDRDGSCPRHDGRAEAGRLGEQALLNVCLHGADR